MENKELQVLNNNVGLSDSVSLTNFNNLPEETRNELSAYAYKKGIDLRAERESSYNKTEDAKELIDKHMEIRNRIHMNSQTKGHDSVTSHIETGSGNITIESRSGHCYVATATYQDAMHPDVILLRDFRDRYLKQSFFGRMFIASYYKVGPYLAYFPEQSLLIRKCSRRLIETIVSVIRDKYYTNK